MAGADVSELLSFVQAGRHQDAERMALGLLTRDSHDSGFLWKVLGICLWAQRKDAQSAFEKAAELLPNDPEVHSNLSAAQLARGQFESALQSTRRALELSPGFPQAHAIMGEALFRLHRVEDAIVSYRSALQARPRDAAVHNNLGNALLESGRTADAVASYRRAVQINKSFAGAYSNLGNALQRLGQFDEALVNCRRALQLRPDSADAHNNLGNALRGLKRPGQALTSYQQAVNVNPTFAVAHANAGDALLELGRFAEAMANYRRAVEIAPAYAQAHAKLGHLLVHSWRCVEAIACCRQALALKPDYAEAYNALGSALFLIGARDPEASFRQALKLKPDYAEAHVNLALALRLKNRLVEAEASCSKALELCPSNTGALVVSAELHGDNGRFDEAERLYRCALSIDTETPAAYVGIAQVRKMSRSDSQWLSEAQRLADSHQPPRSETALRYAMGKYFDDVGDFDAAFSHYRRANEISKVHRRRYDRHKQEEDTNRLIRFFDRDWLMRRHETANPSERPVFVIGLPRSGTTLATQILASHPEIVGAGTPAYWIFAMSEYEAQASSATAGDLSLGQLADRYLRELDEFSTSTLRVVDKMTYNFMCVGLIHAALPNARFIHMRRNALDTCLSNHFDPSNGYTHVHDLEHMAHYYHEYARLMDHWRMTLSKDTMLEIPYESLIADQESWTRRMLEFLRLPWDARCLDFHRTPRPVITASKWQVRQKIGPGRIGRWRNYEKFISPLLRALEHSGDLPRDARL